MYVRAVPSLVGPGLGGERGDEIVSGGDSPDRLPDQHLDVCSLDDRAGGDRQLLLTVSELDVVLLDGDALPLERLNRVVDHLGCGGHPDGREAQAVIDGNKGDALL